MSGAPAFTNLKEMEELEKKYTKIPAVKRLMREACELREATEDYSARPLEDNLFEWHFTVRGAPATEFENGLYHGRIILPNEYPMKPPNIILLTPNGRFETNKKICLSISGYHPETWQPSWSIRTALLALIAFMPTPGKGTIGSLDYTPDERKVLAKKSLKWECSQCGPITNLLGASAAEISSSDSHLIQRVVFKGEEASVKSEPPVTKDEPRSDRVIFDNNVGATPREGFYIGERTSTVLIAFLVAAISFLVYRRLFLFP